MEQPFSCKANLRLACLVFVALVCLDTTGISGETCWTGTVRDNHIHWNAVSQHHEQIKNFTELLLCLDDFSLSKL